MNYAVLFYIACIVIIIMIFVIRNLLRKLEAEEDNNSVFKESLFKYDLFMIAIRRKIISGYEHMKRLDKLGSFESDDETGVIFDTMKEIINDLKEDFEWVESDQINDTTSQKKPNKQ